MPNTVTPKQMDFIKALIKERDQDPTIESVRLDLNAVYLAEEFSKAYASGAIDRLMAIAKNPKTPASKAPAVVLTEGYYTAKVPGTVARIYKVVNSKTGNPYAKPYDERTGKYAYESGSTASLRAMIVNGHADKLTLDDAKAVGKATGRCVICGAELTNPESIDRGIGPVCAGRL